LLELVDAIDVIERGRTNDVRRGGHLPILCYGKTTSVISLNFANTLEPVT